MPREEWCKAFLLAHRVAGVTIGSPTLQSVPVRGGADDAAGAIYDGIVDTPMLHWLIQSHSVWMQRAMVIGAFYLPLARELKEERAGRRAKPVNPKPAPAAEPESEFEAARRMQGVVA